MLLLSAEHCGLGACWVQIRERLQEDGSPASLAVRDLLHLKPEQEPLCIVAIGKKAQDVPPHAEEDLRWERLIIHEN
jgi:nitroreductase